MAACLIGFVPVRVVRSVTANASLVLSVYVVLPLFLFLLGVIFIFPKDDRVVLFCLTFQELALAWDTSDREEYSP